MQKVYKFFSASLFLFCYLLSSGATFPPSSTNEVILRVENGFLKVHFVTDLIVRVQFSKDSNFSKNQDYIRIPIPESKQTIAVDSSQTQYVDLRSPKLHLKVDKTTGAISYYKKDGTLILSESAKNSKILELTDVIRKVPDSTSFTTVNTVDGERRVASRFTFDTIKAYRGTISFDWNQEEALYGLGSHEEDYLNLKGKAVELYQHNMKMTVPFLVSTKGYGLLFDHYSHMRFDDTGTSGKVEVDSTEDLDYYFVYGQEGPKQAIRHYRMLTGKASMLPKYAFGYTQSKERYKSQDELVNTVREFRKRQIPLDLIVQDWRYWPKDAWSGFIWDKERYPDPARMVDDIHDMNANVMISIWPNIGGGPNQQTLKKSGLSLVGGDIVDVFDSRGRELYWSFANDNLFSKGIDAFWTDSSEPTIADWTGKKRDPNFDRINKDRQNETVGPFRANAYGLLHAKGIYENQRRTTNQKRVYSLTRSAYAGIQRYGAVSWSGDVAAKWSTLQQQIPAGLNFVASGVPYWTNDAGAFFVQTRKKDPRWFWNGDYQKGIEDLGYRELYTRWLQYATFLPIMRSHGTDTPREPWQFGEPGTPFYDSVLKYINLRYQLLPYIYATAAQTHYNDASMMLPLAMVFPKDRNVFDLKNQFMFGDSFMVCPVTQPMYYQPNSKKIKKSTLTREVYLPEGTDWYDFWTGKKYQGGQTLTVSADISTLPLFVKAGSIIPMTKPIQHTGQSAQAPVEFRVYPGKDTDFFWYDDDGKTYDFEKGWKRHVGIHWMDKEGILKFDTSLGHFPGEKELNFSVVRVTASEGIGNQLSSDKKVNTYSGQSMSLKL